jgi:hypothetical protein
MMPPAILARAVEAVRATLQNVRYKMVPPFAGVLDLAMGFAVARRIYAAARLGIADVLADGPLTAGRSRSGPTPTGRRACCSNSQLLNTVRSNGPSGR